ncbi:MAG: metal-dependent hydrolase [Acidimicrobiales bacterium]|nr:metal-dependent hydrolase [Acidimicrobiales bacterium]
MARDVLTVRRVRFEYPPDANPLWNRRFPEFAFAANGISLLMPYAEPYFVRSIRAVVPQLGEPLKSRTEDFLRQEMQHQRQHRRFNDIIATNYRGVPRLERSIRRTYGWLSRTRSQRFNLAFAAGSETIAFSLARWTDRHIGQLFVGADPVPATMYLWHLAEEVEHKSVAFDVYEAVDGSRLRYAVAIVVSLLILMWFVWLASLVMLYNTGRLFSPVAHLRLIKWSVSLGMTMLPTMAASALPGHHPEHFADPEFLSAWLRQYDPINETMPLWQG